jgi:hypothetical protein
MHASEVIMLRISCLVTVLSVAPAFADTISIFDLSGTDLVCTANCIGFTPNIVYSPNSFTGNLTIDTTTGTILSASFRSSYFQLPFLLNQFPGGVSVADYDPSLFPHGPPGYDFVALNLGSTFKNYAGGSVFGSGTSVTPCCLIPSVIDISGVVSPEVGATPLPNSLLLFASGIALMGLLGWWRLWRENPMTPSLQPFRCT